MMELKGSDLSILPPTSLLIEVEVKGEDRGDARLDGLFHLLRDAILNQEADLPCSVRPLHTDLLNKGLFTEGREGKKADQKADDASRHPPILPTVFHPIFYIRLPHLSRRQRADGN